MRRTINTLINCWRRVGAHAVAGAGNKLWRTRPSKHFWRWSTTGRFDSIHHIVRYTLPACRQRCAHGSRAGGQSAQRSTAPNVCSHAFLVGCSGCSSVRWPESGRTLMHCASNLHVRPTSIDNAQRHWR